MDEPVEVSMEQLAYQQKEVRFFLEHEQVKKAFQATEASIFSAWKRAETVEARERLRARWDAFQDWQRELRGIASRLPKP